MSTALATKRTQEGKLLPRPPVHPDARFLRVGPSDWFAKEGEIIKIFESNGDGWWIFCAEGEVLGEDNGYATTEGSLLDEDLWLRLED